ncbi:hypothetical protein SK128_000269 [Halocaridina rubra]|uniref:Methyltransferase domain-containing protein n=1 Tax=Halocaridina rubra TaxID=373956 RepID=A0AAN8ZZS3_HALRR
MEEELLTDIVHLLCEFQWLYDFPLTQIFVRDILSGIPDEWQRVFQTISLEDLNEIPGFKFQMDWPTSLKSYLERCQSLSLGNWLSNSRNKPTVFNNETAEEIKVQDTFSKGLSDKKRHEVTALVRLSKQIAVTTGCKCVIDIGSGMGYIDSLLHQELNIPVMGIESDENLVQRASTRQNRLSGSCKGVKYINWTLSDDEPSYEQVKELIRELISNEIYCNCCNSPQGHSNGKSIDSDQGSHCHMQGHNQNMESGSFKMPEPSNTQDTSYYISVDSGQGSGCRLQGNDQKEEGGSFVMIEPSLNKPSSTIMLLGLHSCADLSPLMIEIFKDSPEIKSLVLLSCCYHKMRQKGQIYHLNSQSSDSFCSKTTGALYMNTCNNFQNFPLSSGLKRIMEKKKFSVSVYGLRLAAQESGLRWSGFTQDDHLTHERNVAYRALLEAYCIQEGYVLKKRRRRCARKSKFTEFGKYLKTAIENYDFVPVTQKLDIAFDLGAVSKNIGLKKSPDHMPMENEAVSVENEHMPVENDQMLVEDYMPVENDHIPLKNNHIPMENDRIPVENYRMPEENHHTPMANAVMSNRSSVSECLNPTRSEYSVLCEHITLGLHSLQVKYSHLFPLIEGFSGLQLALQPVLEALVLIDRVAYLKELGFHKVGLERVFDEKVSPRSVALIAIKE